MAEVSEDAPIEAAAPAPSAAARIEAWFVDWFHGAPAMRDTEAYNHVRRAVDDLKRREEERGQ